MNPSDIDLVDYDHYAREGAPHDQFAWLRANAPVFRHKGDEELDWPAFWAVTKLEDVVTVSRNSDLYSSSRRLSLFPEVPEEMLALQRMMMLNQDPPEHTRRRSLVNRGFTPRAINVLEQHIRDICDQLFDEAEERSEIDFVRDIAAPLPLYVICELLGAPVEDRDKIFSWSNQMIGADDPDYAPAPDEAGQAAMQVYAYANQLAAERRENPRDDIVTKLLQPGDGGEVLSQDEFDLFVLLLVVAGNETTRNAASGGMLALFEHPEQWDRLVADPSLARTAADEIVRWVSPVNLFRRTATADTVLGDQKIGEGDKVVVFYTSANRDESVFAAPTTFDIGRDPNPHIGFGGGGAHFCLGNHLAKMELRVLFETLARRYPKLHQTGEARRLRSYFINGIKDLPVALG
ncbi:cytochrome P450 [Microtetraspora sp. NBRC 13810]|uniref:cytochrome P450 n=1 Tax=Microtetraspora sp. NBRC 13810 TaxID=3030990 RepID=UPI0025566A36|nr:cytochrome P450 [Microtetraspora sp. NBRC 13810]